MPIRQAVCVPGARRSAQPAREGEQRMGIRATHHDVRNQAEMGWWPDEPQPPLQSWAFKRALGHQGTGAVAFDQGSRVQHCLASASPGRPPLLRPATWAGGGHAPCSQGNSNCAWDPTHALGEKTHVRRVPRSGREPAGRPEQSQPRPCSTGAVPTAPGVPRGCALSRWGAQGLGRCWQRRGPSALSSRPGRPSAHPRAAPALLSGRFPCGLRSRR